MLNEHVTYSTNDCLFWPHRMPQAINTSCLPPICSGHPPTTMLNRQLKMLFFPSRKVLLPYGLSSRQEAPGFVWVSLISSGFCSVLSVSRHTTGPPHGLHTSFVPTVSEVPSPGYQGTSLLWAHLAGPSSGCQWHPNLSNS